MKLIKTLLISSISIALISGVASAEAANSSVTVQSKASFSAEQKQEIGEIAAEYLENNPSFLIKASENLRKQQENEKELYIVNSVLKNQQKLLFDKETPTIDPNHGKVAVIEFFDYQCIYCSKIAPVIENVMKNNQDIRFIFKEYPIFATQWPASKYAAQAGYIVYKKKGAQAYLQYHNNLYQTGKVEGQLTVDDVNYQLNSVLKINLAVIKHELSNADLWLDKEMALGQSLPVEGTPGFIIMPLKNANAGNVRFIPGFVNESTLQKAINEVKDLSTKTD